MGVRSQPYPAAAAYAPLTMVPGAPAIPHGSQPAAPFPNPAQLSA